MRLLQLDLTNFCQHAAATFHFHPGLVCVRGPNGAGKSNLVTAVAAALTNDFPRGDGGREANVTFGRTGPSGVSLRFEHNGVVAVVERGLRPAFHRLTVGDRVFNKEADVRRELEAFLGISAAVLRNYVFVGQGRLTTVLTGKDADRVDALHQLFGLDRAEAVWKALRDAPLPAVPTPADVTELAKRIRLTEVTLTQLDAAIADGPADSPEALVAAAAVAKQTADRYSQATAATAAATRVAEDVKAAAAAATNRRAAAAAAAAAAATAAAAAATAEAAAVEAYAAVGQWSAIGEAHAAYDDAQAVIDAAVADATAYAARPLPDDYLPDTPPMAEYLRGLVSDAEWWARYAATFAPGGCHLCPTCGTAVASLPTDPATAAEAAANKAASRRTAEAAWNCSRQFDASERQRAGFRQTATAKAAAATRRRDDVDIPPSPAMSWETAVELTRRVVTAANESLLAGRAAATAGREAEVADGRLADKVAEVGRLTALAATPVDATQAAAADAEAVRLRTVAAAKMRQLADRDSGRLSLASDRRAAVAAAPLVARADRAAALSDHLSRARDVFHRQALPAVLAARFLSAVVGDLNDLLFRFDAGFSVTVAADLRFVATLPSGAVQPADRLSWGQQAVLAIAFRVAVNATYAGDLGVLSLDEPTAGLDERNLRGVETALGRLRELSASQGLQVLLVTHEKGLDHLFDQVIQLPAGGD